MIIGHLRGLRDPSETRPIRSVKRDPFDTSYLSVSALGEFNVVLDKNLPKSAENGDISEKYHCFPHFSGQNGRFLPAWTVPLDESVREAKNGL